MKQIAILTSLLTLSACGGGFFGFDYYDKEKEKEATATETQETTTNIINPANENIIKITSLVDGSTNLEDVELYEVDSKNSYTFVLDGDGRINQVVKNYDGTPSEYHDRQGNNNEFISQYSGNSYALTTYGNGNLQYSDFGIWNDKTKDYAVLVTGGYNSKAIDAKSDVMETQLFNGPEHVFTGSAVAKITKYGIGEATAIIASTDNAELRFSSSGYVLNMPFHSNKTGADYYDVVVSNSDTTKPTQVMVNFGGDYTGDYRFVTDTGSGFSKQSEMYPGLYGDSGNVTEIVGSVSLNDKDEASAAGSDEHKFFEAAYGVKKQ